jgi:hypothetical protein
MSTKKKSSKGEVNMGIGEFIGEVARVALSKPQRNEYVVLDQYDRQHQVEATDAQQALTKVINKNLFTVDGNRCSVVKI